MNTMGLADTAVGDGAAAPERPGGSAALIALALAYVMLLVALIALCANYPAGYQTPYGLTEGVRKQYGSAWRYPALELPPGPFAALFVSVLLALWVVYALAARWLARRGAVSTGMILPVLATSIVLYNVALAVAFPPIISSDPFAYAIHGQVVLRGDNPYAGGALTAAEPPLSDLTPWRTTGAEYGPVWVQVGAGLAFLSGRSVVRVKLVYCGFGALCNLGAAWLAYLIARGRGTPPPLALLVYGWNPLLLIELAGSGHNDALMVTLALLGIYLAEKNQHIPAWIVLLLSMLVKYVTGLLVALYGVFWLARAAREGRLGREFAALALSGIGVLGVAYLPFARGVADIRELLPLSNLIDGQNANILHALLQNAVAHVPGSSAAAWDILKRVLAGAFAALLCVPLARLTRRTATGGDLLRWAGWLTLLYVVAVYGALFPWYLVVPMAIACTSYEQERPGRLLVYTCAAAILYMLPYAMLRPG